jgi:hypothetical protein
MVWIVVSVFWSTVVIAAMAFSFAFARRRPGLALVAAILAAPFCLIVGGYPHPIGVGARVALVANFGAAWLLHRRQRRAAMTLLIPFGLVVLTLAYFIVNQRVP